MNKERRAWSLIGVAKFEFELYCLSHQRKVDYLSGFFGECKPSHPPPFTNGLPEGGISLCTWQVQALFVIYCNAYELGVQFPTCVCVSQHMNACTYINADNA